jgi:cytidine deaminase
MNDFTLYEHFDDLDTESQYLIHKAKDAATHAYAPYSKFLVGSAVLLEDGSVVTGSNQENASYPAGMCGERVALFAVIAAHPEAKIKKIAVVAKRKSSKDLIPASSCGQCRQVMLEFETRQENLIEIVMQAPDHRWVKAVSAASLLPFSFSKDSLEHHEK